MATVLNQLLTAVAQARPVLVEHHGYVGNAVFEGDLSWEREDGDVTLRAGDCHLRLPRQRLVKVQFGAQQRHGVPAAYMLFMDHGDVAVITVYLIGDEGLERLEAVKRQLGCENDRIRLR